MLDSMAYHLPLIRKGGVVKKQEVPRGSAAWIERRALDQMRDKNNMLPRRFRKRLPGLAFS